MLRVLYMPNTCILKLFSKLLYQQNTTNYILPSLILIRKKRWLKSPLLKTFHSLLTNKQCQNTHHSPADLHSSEQTEEQAKSVTPKEKEH